MEPNRRPSGRRLLLPYEIDLCESLGITAEEYWEFIFAAQEHAKERTAEYAKIPEISNGPVAPILLNLVIGLALSAISALLAPKPKAPKPREQRRLDIGGQQGRTKFTRSNNFDSVQQLANLGETIPLIFADHTIENSNSYGGVRVDTELLHSQMITSGNNQLLFALMMFGMGNLGEKPDYDGYAIGDLLLRDFSDQRNALYYGYSERLKNGKTGSGNQYDRSNLGVPNETEDAFSVFWTKTDGWQPYFSGTRTPSTKVQFGCYGPIPNGHRFHMPLELVMRLKKSGSTAKKDADAKRRKLANSYPRFCGITGQQKKQITYQVLGKQMDPEGKEEDNVNPDVTPWGQADAISIQNETRVSVDEVLQPNQDFMFGSGVIGRVKSRPDKLQPWDPIDSEKYTYTFELEANTAIDFARDGDIAKNDDKFGGARPWSRSAIQQVAVASLTNSRPCHATEIGIKSEVWRQMTSSVNFNGWPKEDLLKEYEDEGDQITVGSVTKYMKRYSFFRLEARPHNGANNTKLDWLDITGDSPFAIRGTSPTNQYNTIHINHPGADPSVHEYRLVPVPGFVFYDRLLNAKTANIKLLTGSQLFEVGRTSSYSVAPNGVKYNVSFTGAFKVLTQDDAANPEWIFGYEGDLGDRVRTGPIAALETYVSDPRVTLPPVVELPDTLNASKYKPAQPDKACVQVGYKSNNPTEPVVSFFWNGKELTGNRVDSGGHYALVRTEGSRVFTYKSGDLRQILEFANWKPVSESPDYVVSKDVGTDPIFGYGYTTCVYLYNDTFYYRWDNVTVASYRANGREIPLRAYYPTGVNEVEGNARYRVEMDGDSVAPALTNDTKVYTDDELLTDLFVPRSNTRPNTGAVYIGNDKWAFYKNGANRPFGITTGVNATRNLYDDGNTDNNRWRAMDVMVPAAPFTAERTGVFRECDPSNIVSIQKAVTTGFVLLFESEGGGYVKREVEVFNSDRTKSRMVQLCKMFLFSDRVINNQPCEDYDGNNIVYHLGSQTWDYDRTKGGTQYRPYKAGLSGSAGEEDPPFVGPPEWRSPCYQVSSFKVTEEVLEQRAITYQLVSRIFPTWRIEKEEYDSGKPEKYVIEKWNSDNTEEEQPVITTEQLRTEKTNGDEPRNKSATVELKKYSKAYSNVPGKLAYSWKLLDEGDNYAVGEKVLIGKDLGLNTTVTQIITGSDQDTDNDPNWDNMTGDTASDGRDGPNNYFPLNAICDYYINNTDTSSHANGPEHSICFCNELIKQPGATYGNLALAGIKLTNSKEWSSFSNLTAWIAKGIQVERLIESGTGSTNLFPEIAYALLTDDRIGAGKSVGAASVDRDAMKKAAQFCRANNFYWDGVITDAVNLREFIFANAGYILCDFTIKGGKFALVPSVPYNNQFKIAPDKAVDIKCLFTDGNMKAGSMSVTFLSPEERQLFQAVVLYRSETKNGFPETRTMLTRLASGSDTDPIEEFDLTQFCTSETQARTFSRVALKLRELVDHGITFETTPQSAMMLEPGEYFKVATKVTHTDRFESGSIDPSGNVIYAGAEDAAGVFNVVYWKPGDTETRTAQLRYSRGKTTQTALWGTIWTKVVSTANTRVYKCETLSYADDGLVSVSGSFAPLTSTGSLAIMDYNDADFEETTISS